MFILDGVVSEGGSVEAHIVSLQHRKSHNISIFSWCQLSEDVSRVEGCGVADLHIVELDVEPAAADGELGVEDLGEGCAELPVDAGAEAADGHDLAVRRGLLAPGERRRHRPVDRHQHVLPATATHTPSQSVAPRSREKEEARHSVEQAERVPVRRRGEEEGEELRILACR